MVASILQVIKLVQSKGLQFIQQHGRGKTGAVKTAIEPVATPYLLVVDGDYTYPAADIERLFKDAMNQTGFTGFIKHQDKQSNGRIIASHTPIGQTSGT